jgi:hypothetical protein
MTFRRYHSGFNVNSAASASAIAAMAAFILSKYGCDLVQSHPKLKPFTLKAHLSMWHVPAHPEHHQ